MTIDAFLGKLYRVRARGANRWMAKCPAHPDKSPSLSIRETDDGTILLTCFAACSVSAICAALNIELNELFADRGRTSTARPKPPPTVYPVGADPVEIGREHFLAGVAAVLAAPYPIHRADSLDLALEAEHVITAAQGLDISTWTDGELDRRLIGLTDAYAIVEEGDADAG